MPTGAAVKTISPPYRSPSGRKRYNKRAPGSGTIWKNWRSLRDNWTGILQAGHNPMFTTVLGKLYLDGVLTETEASAGRLYGEIMGRFDRYFSAAAGLKGRTCRSPAYESGRGGQDDEIERRTRDKSLGDYERKAKNARKAYEKLRRCVPTLEMIGVLDKLCCADEHIGSGYHADIKMVLGVISKHFGLKPQGAGTEAERRRRASRSVDIAQRVEAALDRACDKFKMVSATPAEFELAVSNAGERGVTIYGQDRAGTEIHSTVLLTLRDNDIPGAIDHAFLVAVEARKLRGR